jgi:hypothetical protein
MARLVVYSHFLLHTSGMIYANVSKGLSYSRSGIFSFFHSLVSPLYCKGGLASFFIISTPHSNIGSILKTRKQSPAIAISDLGVKKNYGLQQSFYNS